LSPKRATITALSISGVSLDVVLATTNPNSFDLTASDVTAHFLLGGNVEVGTATFSQTIVLPASSTKDVDVPLTIRWVNLVPLVQIAESGGPTVPYAVDGSLALGGGLLHIPVPFHIEGSVTREEIQRAVGRSIPALPGLPAIPRDPAAQGATTTPDRRIPASR
jgi:LEA14-like dessication related protein